MTELVEVAKGSAGGAVVVEHDVGDARDFDMRGDADDGKRNSFGKFCIDEEEAVDGTTDEEVGVLLEEIGAAEVTDSEVEVAGLEEVLLDAKHESGEVAFAELGDDYADGVGKAGPEHACMQVGAVVEFLCGVEDALLGLRGDGFGDGRVVKDDGDSCGGEVEIFGEDLEGDGFVGIRNSLFSRWHGASSKGRRMQQFYTATIREGNRNQAKIEKE
jgi:hypothetical protein